jgi:hypothetical protein
MGYMKEKFSLHLCSMFLDPVTDNVGNKKSQNWEWGRGVQSDSLAMGCRQKTT